MTSRDTLIELAKSVAERKLALGGLGMVNVSGQTPEQRVDLDAAYRVALDEYMIAERAYADALANYEPEGAGAITKSP